MNFIASLNFLIASRFLSIFLYAIPALYWATGFLKSILARTLEPHDFKNGDYVSVSGISSQSIINLDGVYNIGVQTSMFKSLISDKFFL